MPQAIHLITIIPLTLTGKRIDQALAHLFPQYSRARLTSWLKQHYITVNGNYLSAKQKVSGGEQVIIDALVEEHTEWQPQAIMLDIIYEDDDILVINKPAGLVVHPAAGNFDHTLVNALLYHCPQLASLPRAGLIHRLDKDTTGLLVVAKSLTAHTALTTAMQQRHIQREYQALVYGTIIAGGTIDAPIARHPHNRLKMAVVNSGKPAITHYRVLHRYPAVTHLAISLETGRTHQIRVHFSHIKHPIVGDPVYGGRKQLPIAQYFKRQALHAWRLTLQHPRTQQRLQFTAELPQDFQELLKNLEQQHE